MPSAAGSNVPDVSTSPVASSSMVSDGGVRSVPIRVAAGSGPPLDVTVTVGETISVVVRLVAELPGRNSLTWPLTATASPTATVGLVLVKTKRPSEVAGSASGRGSCSQKPFDDVAVTTPGTSVTACSASGEVCAA